MTVKTGSTAKPPKPPKPPKTKQNRKQQRFYGWSGRLLSLLVATLFYSYYQAAIQAEVSFVLPLGIRGAQDRIVNWHDAQEVTLHLAGREKDLETLRSSDFETYVRLAPSQDGLQRLKVHYR
ncbi:MAG: hypothetical protein AAF975_09190, partial [Spirochaetota bacterium]